MHAASDNGITRPRTALLSSARLGRWAELSERRVTTSVMVSNYEFKSTVSAKFVRRF